jgi:hypothetical protein
VEAMQITCFATNMMFCNKHKNLPKLNCLTSLTSFLDVAKNPDLDCHLVITCTEVLLIELFDELDLFPDSADDVNKAFILMLPVFTLRRYILGQNSQNMDS